jgi:hypothetical protein
MVAFRALARGSRQAKRERIERALDRPREGLDSPAAAIQRRFPLAEQSAARAIPYGVMPVADPSRAFA